MTLAEFLTARYKEDAAGWRAVAARDLDTRVTMLRGEPLAPRMLAEVEAKRRIVTLHKGWHECVDVTGDEKVAIPADDHHFQAEHGGDATCLTLRLLALPYADHPQFDEEWKP